MPKENNMVKIDMEEIIDYRWVDIDEMGKYNLIPGLKKDIMLGYKYYRKIRKNEI